MNYRYVAGIIALLLLPDLSILYAQGISVDAGLTPPRGRLIIRMMTKNMKKSGTMPGSGMEMSTYVNSAVLVYGVRPDLTVMARQSFVNRKTLSNASTIKTNGLSDLFINMKYKALRRNTESFTLGIAPYLGINIPTGKEMFTSNTLDLFSGLFLSYRRGAWGSDFNMSYKFMGITGNEEDEPEKGNEISLDMALGYQFSLDKSDHFTLSPVVEFNYIHIFQNELQNLRLDNSGEKVLFISPGLKFTTSNFIIETIFQPPVFQKQNGIQPERKTGFIFGIRFLL